MRLLKFIVFVCAASSSANCLDETKNPLRSDFAAYLYHNISANIPPEDNLLFSPLSAEVTLSELYLGSCDQTEDEIGAILGFDKRSTLQKIAKQIAFLGNDTTGFLSVNAMFVDSGYSTKKDYNKIVKDVFDTVLKKVDFVADPDSAVKEINEFVLRKGHDFIVQDLFDKGDLTEDTKMVLVNALFLKATWQKQFLKSMTKNGVFHLETPGQTVTTPVMKTFGLFNYDDNDKIRAQVCYNKLPKQFSCVTEFSHFVSWLISCFVQVLELPYENSTGLSMIILLPYENENSKCRHKPAHRGI